MHISFPTIAATSPSFSILAMQSSLFPQGEVDHF